MRISDNAFLVTGGASGLGRGTAERLAGEGGWVTIADLPNSGGEAVAAALGDRARFVPADVTSEADMRRAIDGASADRPLRGLVHCAGRGGPVRVVERDGEPGALPLFEEIVRVNLIGSFNALRLVAARISEAEPDEGGERGVIVLTASVAAFEGQIGQTAYAASKAGIVGMTLVAARDLARRAIRVCTIAPGLFDTPLLQRVPAAAREALGASIPHPSRLGTADEYAMLATAIIANPMLNGETIRLDGALRMAPR